MKLQRNIFKSMLLLSVLWLAGCVSSTELIERWNDTAYVGKPKLSKVLVLGVFRDDTKRRVFESEFVAQVEAGGNSAIAGYTVMPEQADYNDKEDIIAAVKKSGADSVLITSFKSATEQERYVPPSIDYVPSMRMGYGYGAYYGAAYQSVYRPGYTVTDTIVRLETRVYAVDGEQLIWAGNTRSINASSAEKITVELVKLVTDDMRESGLID